MDEHDPDRARSADTPPQRSAAMRRVLTLAFVAAVAVVIGGLYLLSTVAPTLRSIHKGYGRAQCTVCHPPALTHAGAGYTPDSCSECHGPNGAARTTDEHAGWKRADCLASGCHSTRTVHAGAGFTAAGCTGCHGDNGTAAAPAP